MAFVMLRKQQQQKRWQAAGWELADRVPDVSARTIFIPVGEPILQSSF